MIKDFKIIGGPFDGKVVSSEENTKTFKLKTEKDDLIHLYVKDGSGIIVYKGLLRIMQVGPWDA